MELRPWAPGTLTRVWCQHCCLGQIPTPLIYPLASHSFCRLHILKDSSSPTIFWPALLPGVVKPAEGWRLSEAGPRSAVWGVSSPWCWKALWEDHSQPVLLVLPTAPPFRVNLIFFWCSNKGNQTLRRCKLACTFGREVDFSGTCHYSLSMPSPPCTEAVEPYPLSGRENVH